MTLAAFAGVTVSSPQNGATLQSPVTFVASATATGRTTITGMAIYVDTKEVYSTKSASLNTSVTMSTGKHSIVVQATTSSRGTTYSANLSLTVASVPATLQLSPITLANGGVGVAYSATLAATGGTTPYKWSVASGSLPTGLALSSGGAITGTPTAAGTFPFTVTVTDSESPAQSVTSGTLSITVVIAPVQVTTTTLANGTINSTYSATLLATGGIQPYSWSIFSGTLPTGLILAAGGTISGTPTATGASPLVFTVTDAESPSQSANSGTLTLTIGSVAPSATLTTAYAAYTAANYTSNANYSGSNTYYVSSTGSDSNSGSAASPWATMAHAATTVTGCALVLVEPGTYAVATGRVAKITNNGTSSCHTAYVATAYSSSYLVATDDDANDATVWINASYVDVVGFDITNPKGCIGVYPSGTYTNLYYNRIHDIDNGTGSYSCGNGVGGGGILGEIGTSTYNIWSDNIIWNVGPSGDHYTHGIYTTSPYVTIQNNVVYNASGGCIQGYHQPSNNIISNNTLVGCYWGYIIGADSGYTANNMVFNNNIVANNTQYGIYECGAASCGVAMGANNTYSNNITYLNTDGNQMEGGTLVNNLTSNPELVDVASPASGGDFDLESGSPAFAAGTTSDAPLTDILDVSRGTSVTIGAYEE